MAVSGDVFEDFAGGYEAAGAGERAIHHDYFGMQRAGEFDGFVAIAGFADYVDVWLVFEHAAETAADEGVIVDEQDGNFMGHAARAFPWEL